MTKATIEEVRKVISTHIRLGARGMWHGDIGASLAVARRVMLATMVVLCVVTAVNAPPSMAALDDVRFWNGDFQADVDGPAEYFNQWLDDPPEGDYLQDEGPATASIVTSPVRDGETPHHRYSGAFVVPPPTAEDPYPYGLQRSEVRASQDMTNGYPGADVWYGWSTMFPDAAGDENDFNPVSGKWNYFTQFHDNENSGCPPNIGFRADPEAAPSTDVKMFMRVTSGDGDPASCLKSPLPPTVTRTDVTLVERIEPNTWYDFVLHVKWSNGGTGSIEIWVNGDEITDPRLDALATLYNSSGGVYAKQGFYRGGDSPLTSTVFHEGMRQVTADPSYEAGAAFDAVSPDGADVRVSGSTLVVEANPGSENQLVVDSSTNATGGWEYTVTDSSVSLLSAGTGCENRTATEVVCEDTVPTDTPPLTEDSRLSAVTVSAGDMNDSIEIGDGVTVPVTLNGGPGDDALTGGSADDVLNGDSGSDSLAGSAGADVLNGGADARDCASYLTRTDALTIDNDGFADDGAPGEADNVGTDVECIAGGAGNDMITAVASDTLDLYGNGGDDVMTADSTGTNLHGGDGDDMLFGSFGRDWLQGNGGADSMVGGAGFDTVNYEDKATGVTVDNDDVNDDGVPGEGDNVGGDVEELGGGPGDDVITGGAGAENLFGYAGNDLLSGAGGADQFFSDEGTDTVSYASRTAPVVIDSDGVADDGEAGENDNIYDTEHLIGGAGNDTLGAGYGDDVLDCGAGRDVVDYSTTTSGAGVSVDLALAGAQSTGGSGVDTLRSCNSLIGSPLDDVLRGDGDDNVIDGSLGDDVVDGAGGVDTIDYGRSTSGVTIDLSISSPQDTGAAGVDTISNMENVIGGSAGDTLGGTPGDNVIDGGGGIDMVTYDRATASVTVSLATGLPQSTIGAGVDQIKNVESLTGSEFADTLTGSSADNVIVGGLGTDTITANSGDDTIVINHDDNDNTTNCGTGVDAVTADPSPYDPVTNCETVNRP